MGKEDNRMEIQRFKKWNTEEEMGRGDGWTVMAKRSMDKVAWRNRLETVIQQWIE